MLGMGGDTGIEWAKHTLHEAGDATGNRCSCESSSYCGKYYTLWTEAKAAPDYAGPDGKSSGT